MLEGKPLYILLLTLSVILYVVYRSVANAAVGSIPEKERDRYPYFRGNLIQKLFLLGLNDAVRPYVVISNIVYCCLTAISLPLIVLVAALYNPYYQTALNIYLFIHLGAFVLSLILCSIEFRKRP